MSINEFWKDIDDKYRVNQEGQVFNKRTGRFLKPCIDKLTGYVKVNLYCDGKNNVVLLHRLIAETFIPNPDNFPQVHHIDGNKLNNNVMNLEWVSNSAHGGKMTTEQKEKFRKTFQNNMEKRKTL